MIDRIKKKQKLCLMLLGFSCLLVLVAGCKVIPKHYTRSNFDITGIRTIAVLPFENFSSDEFANEKIRGTVTINLLRRDINVIEPGEVLRILKELKIASIRSIQIKDIQEIGKTLDAQAVMMGSVEKFSMSKGISVTYPEVSVSLRLLESTTGNTIWSVSHTTGGASFWTRHFGAESATLAETADKVVKEAFDTLFFKRGNNYFDEKTMDFWIN